MKDAIVTRMHIGADQQPIVEGTEIELSDERFDELHKKGLVKEKGDNSDVQPPQPKTKLAPAPSNKKAADAANKAG